MNPADHLALVEKVARRMAPHLKPRREPEELWGDGYMGLVDATESYRPEKGRFDTYAWCCIRNRILDGVKQMFTLELQDWMEEQFVYDHPFEEEEDVLPKLVQGITSVLQQQVMPLLQSGCNNARLAAVLHITLAAARQIRHRLIVQLRLEAERQGLCA